MQTEKPPKLYAVDVPGLADAVAGCAPSEKHTALLAAIRSFEGFEDAKLATFRDHRAHEDGWTAGQKSVEGCAR